LEIRGVASRKALTLTGWSRQGSTSLETGKRDDILRAKTAKQ